VVVSGRRAEAVRGLVAELGSDAVGVVADLEDPDGVRRMLDEAREPDVIVANAGVEVALPLQELSSEAVERAVPVNLTAPLEIARAALPGMVERRRGHLVFISSVAGLVATPGNGPVYTATKWGIRGLGLALRQELHGTGVQVTTIFPGPIRDAGMFARTEVALPPGTGTNSPHDVARAVARPI